MSSTIRLMCPNLKCRKVLAVPQSARGKTVRCGQCGANLRVPEPSRPIAPAPQG